MIKKVLLVFIMLSSLLQGNAQQVFRLWSETNAPTSNGIVDLEVNDGNWVHHVSEPEMTIYLPKKEKSLHAAVIICPGGGYSGLAIKHEGSQFAEWLQQEGLVGVVLKYRLPNKHKEVPLDDVQQAIRYIRVHGKELDIDSTKVGVAGFSAGGHLASTASTHFSTENNSTRPDFSILFYPVITMGDHTHIGSRTELLGDKPSSSDLNLYSNEKQVSENTPPTLLLLSDDDTLVLPINSVKYYEALKLNKVESAMYIFPSGGHGWGMNDSFLYHNQMLDLISCWIRKVL